MSFDLKSFDRSNGRLTLLVKHTTPGRRGTTIDTEIELHLSPRVVEPEHRVSMLSIDLRWVHAPTVPAMGDELARVLFRVASGLREGPSGTLRLLVPDGQPDATNATTKEK